MWRLQQEIADGEYPDRAVLQKLRTREPAWVGPRSPNVRVGCAFRAHPFFGARVGFVWGRLTVALRGRTPYRLRASRHANGRECACVPAATPCCASRVTLVEGLKRYRARRLALRIRDWSKLFLFVHSLLFGAVDGFVTL